MQYAVFTFVTSACYGLCCICSVFDAMIWKSKGFCEYIALHNIVIAAMLKLSKDKAKLRKKNDISKSLSTIVQNSVCADFLYLESCYICLVMKGNRFLYS